MAKLLDFMSGEASSFDTPEEFPARKYANIVLWVILAFIVVAIAWASLTEINRSVRGSGNIVPSSKLQVVSNLEGGVVEEIRIKPGELVERGEILVRLSPTLTGAAYGSSTAQVSNLQAKVARLEAEVRGERPNYGTASHNQVSIESALYSARQSELQSAMEVGSARVLQAQRAVTEADSLLDARRSTQFALEEELAMIRPLVESKIVPRIDLIKTENEAMVARKEVESAVAGLARARAGVAEARAQTSQARSDWLRESAAELSVAQAELNAKQIELPALSDRVDRTTIRSPVKGRVNRVLVTTIGGSVAAGSPVVEIVPSEDALYVEAKIRPSDIGNVHLGQKAIVEVTAYNRAVYGTLDGTVTSISPDTIIEDPAKETFYVVEIQTVKRLKDGHGNPLEIGPGMVANVNLLGEKRSILSYIFTPLTRLKDTAFRD